jgi:CRP/FNR family cyclic AMP-dependent transcriptional regulator
MTRAAPSTGQAVSVPASAFDRLSPAIRARLAPITTTLVVEAGTVLLRDGTDTPFLAALERGRLALRLRVPELGDRLTVMTVEPGELVGWSAVVPPFRATSDAIATEASSLVVIEAAGLRDILAGDCQASAEVLPLVLEAVSQRLAASSQQLLDLFAVRTFEPW